MLYNFAQQYTAQIASFNLMLLLINAALHVIFAGAVAKDSGEFAKVGQKTMLVSGLIWAFATLLGGVFVAAIYWLIHHSNLTRVQSKGFIGEAE